MSGHQLFSNYPRQLSRSQKQSPGPFLLNEGYHAVHGRKPGSPAAGALFELQGGEIAVYRGEPAAGGGDERQVGPVYALPDGPLAVPTGLVFVRFKAGTSATAQREEIEQSGYEIVQIPGYAPHAAWVRSRNGDIAASLQGVRSLEALPDVEHVEPQMLMESAKR
jgi:hypothetical protein